MATTAEQLSARPLFGGWIEDMKILKDGSHELTIRHDNKFRRVVARRSALPEADITLQSIVQLYGTDESNVSAVELLTKAEPLPVDIKNPDYSDARNRHLFIRSQELRATAMFRHHILSYIRRFLDEKKFFNVQTPILTEASCVCSGDVFAFPYYGKKIANLIQSPWMYADALSAGVERVYAVNPSFRREETATNIHLVEIWQVQVDLTWANNKDIMALEEQLVQFVASSLYENHKDLFEMIGSTGEHLKPYMKKYHKITYDESVEMLKGLGAEIEYGDDYSLDISNMLSSSFDRPYFITDYPFAMKNFWFKKNSNNELTPSNDLFSHGGHGEIIGGGERVTDPDMLKYNLKYFGHDEDEFDWFLETRRYGLAPHAGFSMGFDRLVSMMMGVDDIRKATLFPRLPHGILKP